MATIPKPIDATTIEGWLRDMQCDPHRGIDPTANWRFEVDYPPNSQTKISVLNPKKPARALVVFCAMNLSPIHVAAYEGLDPTEKKDFALDLQVALNRDYIEFQLVGIDPTKLTCPTGVQILSVLFDDGLSLNALAHRMTCVLKAILAGTLSINRYLGPQVDSGGSGQFDFRRLGTIQ
jgi:hypothetical protein